MQHKACTIWVEVSFSSLTVSHHLPCLSLSLRLTVEVTARGEAHIYPQDTGSVRLNVTFLEDEISLAASGDQEKVVRERLGLNSAELKQPIEPISTFSDIIYLDESLRIMIGGNNNLYILVKTQMQYAPL